MSLIDAGPVEMKDVIIGIPLMIMILISMYLMREVWSHMDKKNKFKDFMIFFGGVALLISTALPAALAANLVVNRGGGEALALFASLVVGVVYLLAVAHFYGKYVIYPNEESANGT